MKNSEDVRGLRVLSITLSHLYVGVGLVAAWMMNSPTTLMIVMILNLCLSAVHFADFANFRASGPAGFVIRADRHPPRRRTGASGAGSIAAATKQDIVVLHDQ